MERLIRKSLGMLAPRSHLDLAVKFALFCLLIALWHATLRRIGYDDRVTPVSEMLLEATLAGGPFVLLFLFGSWHQVLAIRSLTHRAYQDPLSGVLNRQTFVNRFGRALPRARCGVLLLLDADHFKRINDQYGHSMGDRCIEAIGHRLNWHLREGALVGRIGGEEFAVFIPNVTEEHAKAVATRLGLPVSFTDHQNQIHASVSLSMGGTFIDQSRTIEQHLVDADEALYASKSNGRSQLRFHNREDVILLGSRAAVSDDDRKTLRTPDARSRSKMQLISG